MRRFLLALTAALALASPAHALQHRAAVLSAQSYPGPWSDDCTLAPLNTTVNNRTVNGLTWTIQQGSVSNTTAVSCPASGGGFKGSAGTSPNLTYASVTIPQTPPCYRVTRTMMPAGATPVVSDLMADWVTNRTPGTNTWDRVQPSASGAAFNVGPSNEYAHSGVAVRYLANAAGNAALTSVGTTATNIDNGKGDSWRTDYCYNGSAWLADFYLNGLLVLSGQTTAGAGITMNPNFGFEGNIPTTAAVKQIEVVMTDRQASVGLTLPNRIASQEVASGDILVRLRGVYSLGAPKALSVTLYDASTSLPVSGFTNKPIAISAGNGTWTAPMLRVPSAPATHFWKVCRTDISDGKPACAYGPIQRPGLVILGYGQSLWQQGWISTAGVTVDVTNYQLWDVDASLCGVPSACTGGYGQGTGAASARVFSPSFGTARTASQMLLKTVLASRSILGGQGIGGGKGGTNASDRVPLINGTTPGTIYNDAVDGLRRGGGDAQAAVDMGGTYDAQNSSGSGSILDYAASMLLIYQGFAAEVGHPIPTMILPLGAVQSNATDANQQEIRRLQWKLTQDYPSYFPLSCGQTSHLAHLSGDTYHLSAIAYSAEFHIAGLCLADMLDGAGTTNKRGIYLNPANTVDDDGSATLTVQVDVPNATSVVLNNTGVATYGFDQGFRFGVSGGTALGALHATSVSVGAVSGGKATFTFGFSGTPFASGHAIVGGPYGINPFNPANGATINNSGATNVDYWMDGAPAALAAYQQANCSSCSITGTALTVTTLASGTIAIGQWVYYSGMTGGAYVVSGSGSSWTLSRASGNVSSVAITFEEDRRPLEFYFDPNDASNTAPTITAS